MNDIKSRIRQMVAFFLVGGILFFLAPPLFAAGEGIVTGNIVNIRGEAGLSSAVKTQVKAGQVLTILDEKNNWFKVRLQTGQEGWISGDFFLAQNVDQNEAGYVVITANVLNVRQGPGTSYGSVTKIGFNEQHQVLDTQNGWYKIKVNNMEGWVSGEHAQFIATGISPGEPAGTAAVNSSAEGQAPGAVMVTGGTVNIRQWNSIEAPVTGQVKNGDSLIVLDRQGDWYQVRLLDGQTGWIAYWLTRPTEGTITARDSIPKKEVLIIPIATGKTFIVLDHGGKPEFVLEGWAAKEYQIREERAKKTLRIELQGLSTRKYEGKIERLGISKIKVYPQYDQAIVEIEFSAMPEFKAGATNAQKITAIQVGAVPIFSGGLRNKLIVLDPGHATVHPDGSMDPGAIGLGLKLQEKDVNLAIALKVKALLEEAGAKVVMTHTGRTTLSLAQRAGIANNLRADVFVSIHANSGKPGVSGHTTYYYAPAGHSVLGAQRYERQKLATLVQREMALSGGRRDVGILESNFAVLRETRVPSILVETAFLSDREEEILLSQDWYRQKLAEGIANGLEAYFN